MDNSLGFEPTNDKIKIRSRKVKETFILFVGCLLFVVVTIVQIHMPDKQIQWLGVLSQTLATISVYLTVRVPKKGYRVAVIFNGMASLIALLSYVNEDNSNALPGIVIPLGTIATLSIIVFFMNRLNLKAKEVQEIKSQNTKDIVKLQEVSIMAMAALAETRDNETGKHIQRTRLYVKILADYLYNNDIFQGLLNEKMISLLVASAPLHDIGKVGIPDSILLKPGPLSLDEFEVVKQHTALGYEAIKKAVQLMGTDDTFLTVAQEIVLYHHERWDGEGYLNHLKGEAIPLSARIMSVADVYDALSSERVYKDIYPHEEALQIIIDGSGTQFDPKIVDAFIACNTLFRDIAEEYREK